MASGKRCSAVVPLLLSIFAASQLLLEAQNTSVTGIVRSPDGEPLAGALVKLDNEALGLGFMVVSQAQGRYTSPTLPPGTYRVRAFGGTRQSDALGPVEVGKGSPGKMDIVLNAPLKIPSPVKRLTDDDYEKTMPEGEGKTLVTSRCATCHSLLPIVSARKTREGWEQTLGEMRDNVQDNRMPLTLSRADGMSQELGDAIVDYLAKNFGPDRPPDPTIAGHWLSLPGGASHPNRNLPPTLLQGASANYIAMEFSLPAGSAPDDIAVDSRGAVWVTEKNTGNLGRFDPDSSTYTRIAVPREEDSKRSLAAVIIDPQDQVWFVDNGNRVRLIHFNPQTREFKTYPIPDYPYPSPNSGEARIDSLRFFDGNVWATGMNSNRILRLDPGTGKLLQYPLPKGSMPRGLAAGGDKKIWYAAQVANAAVRLDYNAGLITGRYKMLTPNSGLRKMSADAEGNLWATATDAGKLVKVEYVNGKITEYTPPTADSGPYAIDVDSKRGLIWFSEMFSDRIGRFDPATKTFVEFPEPSSDLNIFRIEVDRTRPNRIWWAGARGNKLGYIDVTQ